MIGGGASGVLTAYHLLRLSPSTRVVIVESRSQLGLGRAYSTPSMQHLLNVPAGKISALPDQPSHFLHWLQRNYRKNVTAADFIPRLIFGKYLQSFVAEMPAVEHLETEVIRCRMNSNGVELELANGNWLQAQAAVLATGNFAPAVLKQVSEEAKQDGVYCHEPFQESNFANLSPDAPVALIGTGLTAVDVLLRLRETGHRGTVTAISRHGVFPLPHAPYMPLETCALHGKTPRTARTLLQEVHLALKEGRWRAVVDSLRPRTNELWQALPPTEQQRFQRHLRRRWEVARHRMAPAIAERIEQELNAGTLTKATGEVESVSLTQNGLVSIRVKTRKGEPGEVLATRVVNCTGPDTNYRRVPSPFIQDLLTQELAMPGPLGVGLWCDEKGALRGRDGNFSPCLFAIGPARIGVLMESIAIPEIRQQAANLAGTLAHLVQNSSSVPVCDRR